ncbi:MAG: cytochrome c3 family protein [Acidobacteriota bacterium]
MSPARRLLIGAIVMTSGAVGYAAGRALFRPERRVVQPIVFSHQKHAGELEMGCDLCHELYGSSAHAGLPKLTACLECHEEAQTESPEEQRIRDLAGEGEDDVFRKLFRLPDHAFYTHRRHVAVAGLECRTCHGTIAETASPPERPLVRIDMDFCLDCHERSGASDDCTACHR